MRILVISDTHGNVELLKKVINKEKDVNDIIFLGDGAKDIEMIKDKNIIAVKGNNDIHCKFNNSEVKEINNKKIFMTHGHIYHVKITLDKIIKEAAKVNADIILYGHTHSAMNKYYNGVHIMNPGSLSGYKPSYGYIDILDNGDIVTNIVEARFNNE